jgi:hypothetical protein
MLTLLNVNVAFVNRENLKENARLILEENQNLLEQIEVKDQKAQDMHQAHMQEGRNM